MKRLILVLPAIFLLAGLLACSDNSPTKATVPSANDLAGEKSNPWVYGVFHQDITQPAECLGEDIHFIGSFQHRYREVSNAGGIYHFRWQILPITPDSPEFVAIGMTSGTVYELSNRGGRVFQMNLEGAADIEILHDTEVWVAEDGSSFTVTFGWHYVTNGNGVLVVSRDDTWSIDCLD